MYCGDETGSFVGDIGSHVARFGYGGEDSPKYVVPSRVAFVQQQQNDNNEQKTSRIIPRTCYHALEDVRMPMRPPQVNDFHAPVVDPACYLPQGDSIQDWDALEHLWESAFETMQVRLPTKHRTRQVQPSNKMAKVSSQRTEAESSSDNPLVHPLLVVSPGCTAMAGKTQQHRQKMEKLIELCMEKFKCPALFVAPTPMLAAFSVGRSTATVVDVGAGGCRVTPVVDGLVLKQAQRRNGRGGDWLNDVLWHAQRQNTETIQPRYRVVMGKPVNDESYSQQHSRKPNGIFHRWAMQDVFYEFRTSEHVVPVKSLASKNPSVPFINDAKSDQGEASVLDTTLPSSPFYHLPDGTQVNLTDKRGQDMCRINELLFAETIPFSADASILSQHSTFSNAPLHQLVRESLSAVGDVQARKDLCASIVLTGGASHQLEQRLSGSLPIASAFKTKVVASRFGIERSCAAWIGGSILSSLGSFQQLWLSQAEYEEYGSTLAVQRFP